MQTKDTKEQIAARRHAQYLLTHPGAKSLPQIHSEKLAKAARAEKACKACGIVKPVDSFSQSVNTADGLSYVCRECDRLQRLTRNTVPTICIGCGIEFPANEDDAKRRVAKYCNRVCSDKHHARPGSPVGVRGTVEERFWRKVDKSPGQGPKGECWMWIGATNPYGQGVFREEPGRGSLTLAHNLAWRTMRGPIPNDLYVIQRCRNNSCVRCLFLGRRADKNVDAREAKRSRAEKACKKCLEVKPISAYGPSKMTADGRSYRCRECVQERANERYARDPSRREAALLIANRHRALKNGLPGSHTVKEWRDLCAKFKNRCVCCGSHSKLTRDHIIPISDPRSTNDLKNLQPLCGACNASKCNHHATDYRKTPFIRKGQVVMF